jgi:excisionase family DNA binding protein
MHQSQHTSSSYAGESTRQYLTPQEVAEEAGISLSTVWRYIRAGRFPIVQPGGPRCRVLIPRDALQQTVAAVMNSHSKEPVKKRSGPRPKWKQ